MGLYTRVFTKLGKRLSTGSVLDKNKMLNPLFFMILCVYCVGMQEAKKKNIMVIQKSLCNLWSTLYIIKSLNVWKIMWALFFKKEILISSI